MAWDDGLEGVALSIAGTEESPLRVLAGPGTGKTYTMKRRVMRLLEEGADAWRILACTFTRTAARDIGREIADLGVEGAVSVWAGTLHGLCFSILQRAEVLAATGRVARPLASCEERFLRQDLRAFGGVNGAKKKLKAFGAAWARLQNDEPGWPAGSTGSGVSGGANIVVDLPWRDAHRGDRARNALIPSEQPDVPGARPVRACDRRRISGPEPRRAGVDQPVAEHASVTIIGDEDRSIYSFKHAHPDGIVTFADAHPGTHDETLNVCRRCPTGVVALANSLINHNPTASGRPLQPKPRRSGSRSRSFNGHRWPMRPLVLLRTWCGASRKTVCPPGRF